MTAQLAELKEPNPKMAMGKANKQSDLYRCSKSYEINPFLDKALGRCYDEKDWFRGI